MAAAWLGSTISRVAAATLREIKKHCLETLFLQHLLQQLIICSFQFCITMKKKLRKYKQFKKLSVENFVSLSFIILRNRKKNTDKRFGIIYFVYNSLRNCGYSKYAEFLPEHEGAIIFTIG